MVSGVQNEEGVFEAILPAPELEAMYARILASELVVSAAGEGDGPPNQAAPAFGVEQLGRPQRRASRLQGKRLAAAMGITQLALPFRCTAPPCVVLLVQHQCAPGQRFLRTCVAVEYTMHAGCYLHALLKLR